MNKNSKGIAYIVLAAFFFSLMTLFVRLAGDVPTMQKAFFRNSVAAVIALFLLIRSNEGIRIKKGSLKFLVLRASFGTMGLILNFWAIDHLVLADANILNKLSPFFAMFMSIFILSEIPNTTEWMCLAAAFVGAVCVIKPTAGIACLPAVAGAISGFGAGCAYAFVRKLGKMGERGPVIVWFFSAFSTVVTLPFLIFDYHPMDMRQVVILLLAGISAAGGQLSITAAYTYAPAREISVFDYSQVLFAAILGFAFFGEIPDALSILGYAIIIATAVFKWRRALKSTD